MARNCLGGRSPSQRRAQRRGRVRRQRPAKRRAYRHECAATGLAVAERTGATGQDLLCAIVAGYEAAGRIGEALGADRQGFHASVIVAFGGVVTTARLLRLTDEQMAHAISLVATTMGGLAIGTNSWAREYHAGNAALAAVNAVQAASRGYTANEDMLEAARGFFAVFSGETADIMN